MFHSCHITNAEKKRLKLFYDWFLVKFFGKKGRSQCSLACALSLNFSPRRSNITAIRPRLYYTIRTEKIFSSSQSRNRTSSPYQNSSKLLSKNNIVSKQKSTPLDLAYSYASQRQRDIIMRASNRYVATFPSEREAEEAFTRIAREVNDLSGRLSRANIELMFV